MKTKKVYKILDCRTNLYSHGGAFPRWSKSGKAWQSSGALRNHFTNYVNHRKHYSAPHEIPEHWVVEVFEVVVSTANEIYDARAFAAGEPK